MLRTREIIVLHQALWAGQHGHAQNGYRTVDSEVYTFVTQNMTKDSENTAWILEDPDHRRLTWVFRLGKYRGKVKEYQGESGLQIIEIWTLNPDRLVYRSELNEGALRDPARPVQGSSPSESAPPRR